MHMRRYFVSFRGGCVERLFGEDGDAYF
jgi:hypothetical protein